MGFIANLSVDLATRYYVEIGTSCSNCIADKTLEDLRVNQKEMLALPTKNRN